MEQINLCMSKKMRTFARKTEIILKLYIMSTKQNKSNILPIVVMFLLFFMIAFVTNFAGSMGIIVKEQFKASNAMSQLGTFANFIAYACMGIPAGLILKRKGYKFTSLTAVTIGFIGVGVQWLSGYVESFGVYVLGAFIAGFSMCLLNIVVNPMLNTLGGGGNRGNQLIQFGGSCNSIGGTLAPILLGYLIGGEAADASVTDATPAMIIAMSIFLLAFIIIFFTKIPEPHLEKAEQRAAQPKDPHSPLSFRHFVLGAIAIFFYVGIEVGIPNMANLYMTTFTKEQAKVMVDEYNKQQSDADYLALCKAEDQKAKEEKIADYQTKEVKADKYEKAVSVLEDRTTEGLGLAANFAGWLIGFYWLMMMVGRLIGGSIGGKISSKTMLASVSALAIILLLCVMFIPSSIALTIKGVSVPVSMVIMFFCGLCTSVMWGSIFNLAAEGLGKYTPAASGIFMTLVCGGGILPLLQGWVADVPTFGYLGSYVVPIIGLAYILFYALVGSKNVNKDIKVD